MNKLVPRFKLLGPSFNKNEVCYSKLKDENIWCWTVVLFGSVLHLLYHYELPHKVIAYTQLHYVTGSAKTEHNCILQCTKNPTNLLTIK